MDLTPLRDYVVLEVTKAEEKGALILTGSDQEAPNRGRVIKVNSNYVWDGDGVAIASTLKEGQEVLFQPHMFTEYQVDGKKHLIGKQEFIIAIINEQKAWSRICQNLSQ